MKLLLYCTKAKNKYDRLVSDEHYGNSFYLYGAITENFESLNGKIVAECDFEVEEIGTYSKEDIIYLGIKQMQYDVELLKQSCLSNQQMNDYLKLGGGYAILIKNLHIFDKPKELEDYYYSRNGVFRTLGNAPQNMMYAYDNDGNKYIVISIQPKWLCKILNGEKTIEVRKKVLKEMLK